MTSFSPAQIRALTRKLDRRHVHTRDVEGKEIAYIEGWFAIAEANAIFGFGGWDRETVHFERLYERSRGETTSCAYLARVRIRARAGDAIVLREGTGWGAASGKNPADIHERAVKAAETDATKRAFGHLRQPLRPWSLRQGAGRGLPAQGGGRLYHLWSHRHGVCRSPFTAGLLFRPSSTDPARWRRPRNLPSGTRKI